VREFWLLENLHKTGEKESSEGHTCYIRQGFVLAISEEPAYLQTELCSIVAETSMTHGLWQRSTNSHIILLLMEWDESAGLFLPAKYQMIPW
jgi:hypothetical protein